METIIILANALSKATLEDISRLDIQYNAILDTFVGHLVLVNELQYAIYEDGTICKE